MKPADPKTTSTAPSRTFPCPHCQTPTAWQGNPYRPFCSERCKLIDLGKWAMGAYAVPGEKLPPPTDDES